MEGTNVTESSIVNPEKWYTYIIICNSTNIFTCNEKSNALFHLKDLVENKYLPEIRQQNPDRDVYVEYNEGQTRFKILRKTNGIFRKDAVVECATLHIECIPAIRRLAEKTK